MSSALSYLPLESAVAQLATACAHPGGWEAVYGAAVAELWQHVGSGDVPRALAVARIARVLELHTDPDDARHLAEILPVPGRPPGRAVAVVSRPSAPPPPPPPATAELLVEVCRFAGVHDPRPHPVTARWSALATRLCRFDVFGAKEAAPLWSPVRYRVGARRGRSGVEQVSAIVLDFDDGTAWGDVLPRWSGCAAVMHTSWSHTPEAPKWRLVLPLARPVAAARWGPVWAWAAERSGGTCDPKCKDASRIYFVPALRAVDWPREAFVVEGAPVEVPFDVLEPVERRPNAMLEAGRRSRAVREGKRGEIYKLDAAARRELGVRLGGSVVGPAVKGVRCPDCGRPSLTWWIEPGAQLKARCNHQKSCGATVWLDELEAG